jgi:CDP-diacylglycerol--glycerol-3-phosphate 3-phosphatidyltransferase
MVIIGRELVLLGLRAAVASEGRHLEASLLGKWKATVQFVAILLAIVRPDVTIGGTFLDEWAIAFAAIVTAWSGLDYLIRFWSVLRSEP